MQFRKATNDELLKELNRYALKYNRPVRYRHFTREVMNLRAKNGVSHRTHTSSRVTLIDGTPHVKYQGSHYPITASLGTTIDGTRFVYDIRLDSPHLP